jgi:UDP-N-acetylglucosamine 2-epimerase (non-hydrolysing)
MIAIFYGTRPEYIKLVPVITALKERGLDYCLFQVRQHTDLLEGCDWDRQILVEEHSKNRLNNIFASVMSEGLRELDCVIVQGDTATAVAAALSAFNHNIPVHHVEAGLRTYDKKNPFPEEVNRRIISSLASVHYCPTVVDAGNLLDDGFRTDTIVITGNTVIDNLQGRKSSKGNTVIVTMHRRENQPTLSEWFENIERLALEHPEYDFVFPMHPSPEVQKHRDMFEHVRVIDPVDHETMLDMIASCRCVITDSGGIQEESSFFQKRCFVCRQVTERPCPGQMLCKTPVDLYNKFSTTFELDFEGSTPFGDGHAGEKIAEDIQRRV